MAESIRQPDLDKQRAAMSLLGFLIGAWAGEVRLFPPGGDPVDLNQTEVAEFKLGGLILTIEGVGRPKAGGPAVLQAFGIISYDDESMNYRMRAFNDGRFLETDVQLADDGKGLEWGFATGPVRTHSELRITAACEWTELTQLAIGAGPFQKYMELRVIRSA